MPVTVTCPNPACAKSATVAEALLGRTARCRSCGQSFTLRPTLENPAGETTDQHPTAAPAEQPSSLGRFQICERLGAGAFGTVYRAYDPQLDREVAIKVPQAGVLNNPKRAERFLREAKAAARLHHPSIVPVYDAGAVGDTYYIVAALVVGRPLAAAVTPEGMDFRRAAQIVRTLSDAVGYAHRNGIVHRDIKPANILLDGDDVPHLTDFGLATRPDTDERLTREGAVLGTPAYMAPEQASGQYGEARPASDQYSLGSILYELLTGRPPFEGPPAVVLYNAVHTEPPPPRSMRPGLPNELETICFKALSKRPSDRYTDCQALADDLTRWLQSEPIRARSPGMFARATRWARRRPAAALALATVLMLCAALGLAAFRWREPARADDALATRSEPADDDRGVPEQRPDDEARAAAEQARRAAEAEEHLRREQDERREAEERQRLENERRREDERSAKANAERKAADPAPAPKPRTALLRTLDQQAGATCVAFSPNGGLLATGGEDKTVHVWDVENDFREVFVSRKHLSGVTSVAFSVDSRRIASAEGQAPRAGGALRVWEATTGQMYNENFPGYLNTAFSADGKYLVACCTETHVNQPQLFNGKTRTVSVKATDTTQIGIWDVSGRFSSLKGHTGRVRCVAIHPNSLTLASGAEDRMVRLWILNQNRPVELLPRHDAAVSCIAFNHDGTRLTTGSADGNVIVWNMTTRKAERMLQLAPSRVTGLSPPVTDVTFSPDGRQLAVSGGQSHTAPGQVSVWDAPTGKLLATLPDHAGAVNGVAYNRAGDRLVTACADGKIRVWDISALIAANPGPGS